LRAIVKIAGTVWLAALLGCGSGGDGDSEAGREPATTDTASPPPVVLPADEPQKEPLSIDPNREEAIRTGTPAERLIAKYELLGERIRLERAEGVFNIPRVLELGLEPLAAEHHRLLEEGVIDTALTVEFVHLAEFMLFRQIYTDSDPTGTKLATRLENLRKLLPEHETVP